MAIRNQVQLISYADSLGGSLKSLSELLDGPLADAARGGIHILPPFPSSADRGFAPMTYDTIDPHFGTWEDIARIGRSRDVLLDFMVNHISRESTFFRDFLAHGRTSKYADLFLTLDKIWPDGVPSPEEVALIFLRKPKNPFSDVSIADTGKIERLWTSFGKQDSSEQIDLDIASPLTREFIVRTLEKFRRENVRMVRLDAVGYVVKKRGTSCFMVEPEIYGILDWLSTQACALGIELLPEVHSHPNVQRALADHGYWVYDFVLPMLVLSALVHGTTMKLRQYLEVCPRRQFTMLDCHDGIPVQPDLDSILDVADLRPVVQLCIERGANMNRILSDGHRRSSDFDVHQINCTYYSALGCDDDAYLAARAIQFFAPGIPQVYYVGLLAGRNDADAVRETGEGRTINRHNYSNTEIEKAMSTNVVQRLFRLVRFRNNHPAFNGKFSVGSSTDQEVVLCWTNERAECTLRVNVTDGRTRITHTEEGGATKEFEV